MARDSSCKWHTEVVFTLTRPSAVAVDQQIAAAGRLPSASPRFLSLSSNLDPAKPLPFGFVHDFKRSVIGHGQAEFAAGKWAFQQWTMFDLGWARVVNSKSQIEPKQIVAVEVHSLGLWTVNLSQILEMVDSPTRFGFIYATTKMHVEQGEERFLLDFDPNTGDLHYELEAVSRPRNLFAWMGYPVTRAFQHRFARDSHRRMRRDASCNSPGF